MIMTKTTPKIEYSEHEAATIIGVSIDQLRSMIRNHIVKDEGAGAPVMSTFQASDLVVLRILAGIPRNGARA
jgi:hypothetical protein